MLVKSTYTNIYLIITDAFCRAIQSFIKYILTGHCHWWKGWVRQAKSRLSASFCYSEKTEDKQAKKENGIISTESKHNKENKTG